MTWDGVWPAITTPFDADVAIDLGRLRRKVRRLREAGCAGVVALGTLGETPSLGPEEKEEVVRTVREEWPDPGGLCVGVSGYSTEAMARWAVRAKELGAGKLMVLPPYVYRGDEREVESHFDRIFSATELPCMLYNNPISYGTDVRPSSLRRLAGRHAHFVAVKESSGEIGRFTEIARDGPTRLARFVGIDEQIVDGVRAGAVGWVAGLANALPEESIALLRWAREGPAARADELYRWFLPLLRMDSDPKLVQRIKLVEEEVGLGPAHLRAPRLPLVGPEREATLATIRERLARRPALED